MERQLSPPLSRLVLTAWDGEGGGAVSCLDRRGTQPAFMPENSSSCSPDAMESAEKMVQGGYGEQRCGAVLARCLALFK